MIMGKLKSIITAVLAVLMAACLCGCGGAKAGTGPRVMHNVARFYYSNERKSVFAVDGKLIDGSVTGMAEMTTSARGDTSLAWVDSALYFVSEKGVDSLGTGIGTAEISFDGRIALYQEGNELKLYRLEDRSITVIDSGIASIVQFAVSPSGSSIAYTCAYEGAEEQFSTALYKDGAKEPLLAGGRAAIMAISDDAARIWYFDLDKNALCVTDGGDTIVVSSDVGPDANYNFTNDLGEVAFNTSDGMNHLYRLASKSETELGTGFDFTLKTDVFSISTVTFFTFINDVSTFTDGLWQKRVRSDDGTLYSVGFIDGDGNIAWLAENAASCGALADGSRVIWVIGGQLYSTDMEGNNTKLASDVDEFFISESGNDVYFLSEDVLYHVSGEKRPERIGEGVIDAAVRGNVCVYVTEGGELKAAKGNSLRAMNFGAVSLDARSGQMIAYADPRTDGDTTLYKAYISADGLEFTEIGDGIRR